MCNFPHYPRALRRHHNARLKAVRSRHYHVIPFATSSLNKCSTSDQRRLGKALHTPCLCSCWMCGNPRHYGQGPTLAERRAAEAFRLDLRET